MKVSRKFKNFVYLPQSATDLIETCFYNIVIIKIKSLHEITHQLRKRLHTYVLRKLVFLYLFVQLCTAISLQLSVSQKNDFKNGSRGIIYSILFLSIHCYNNYYSAEEWMHEMLTPEYNVTAPHCSRYLYFLYTFTESSLHQQLRAKKLCTVEFIRLSFCTGVNSTLLHC